MSKFRLVTAVSTWVQAKGRPPQPRWLSAEHNRGKGSAAYWTKIYWATPPWLTRSMADQMKAIYESAGPAEHVDHIVPLKNALVCGLNVPWNLQVMEAKKNMSKSNLWWDNHPFENLDMMPPLQEKQRQRSLFNAAN